MSEDWGFYAATDMRIQRMIKAVFDVFGIHCMILDDVRENTVSPFKIQERLFSSENYLSDSSH